MNALGDSFREEKDLHFERQCLFFVTFNYKPCCIWLAVLFPDKNPEELVKGCMFNCKFKRIRTS